MHPAPIDQSLYLITEQKVMWLTDAFDDLNYTWEDIAGRGLMVGQEFDS